MPLKGPGFNLSQFDGLSGGQGKSQKDGQEDQGTLKQLAGPPLALLSLPGPPGLPSGSSLGSLTIHQTAKEQARSARCLEGGGLGP